MAFPPHSPNLSESSENTFRKQQERTLYLFLDMAQKKRDTPGETFFEVVRKIIDLLLEKIPDPETQMQLVRPFRMLTNLREQTREYEHEDQLAEFVRFTDYSCYPVLGRVLESPPHLTIIEFKGFEHVVAWGRKFHNYLFDSLLKNAGENRLRFVIFVQSDQKPRLFYGSDEESSRDKVSFYRLSSPQSSLIPNQYDVSDR